jgi:long-chain acyl-CoA synthetase
MSVYASKPWLALYGKGQPAVLSPRFTDALALFRSAVAAAPESPAIHYFDATLSYRELDEQSEALAVALLERGFRHGERLGLFLQNVPHFYIALLAAWKAGGIVTPINPMNREREVALLLADARPSVLISQEDLYGEVIANLDATVPVPKIVWLSSPLELQSRNDPRLFKSADRPHFAGVELVSDVIAATRGRRLDVTCEYDVGDAALIVYTSGTTGLPKGALVSHGSFNFAAQVYRDWVGIEEHCPILGVAPLFHITGLILHISLAMQLAAPLILSYRFNPEVTAAAIIERRPGFVVGAMTVFIALLSQPQLTRAALAPLTKIYSGGAPVSSAIVAQFRERFGHTIHNCYGLTETAAPVIVTPFGTTGPVDASSGALSIGVPVCNVEAWIGDDAGHAVPLGTIGELIVSGPMVSSGYWEKPQETTASMRPDGFRTGDLAFMDEQGWFYIVDRKKDMIISSGYKVWPREVEDVLYTHPAVREAAVVGVAHKYRGENVKAVVSLKAGAQTSPEEIVAFCAERMAAYKYPRIVEIIDELPKTASGKILRRSLRERATGSTS